MSKFNKNMSFDNALGKAMRYCSYQERCVFDLEKRFFAWNVKKSDWNKILTFLKEDNYLNETRFITAFVRGKFNMKKWGKNKIILGLLQKKISGKKVSEIINTEINEAEYLQTINDLIHKKSLLIDEPDVLKKRNRLYRYLLGKGFESEMVSKELNLIDY
jgi:regulatory protein